MAYMNTAGGNAQVAAILAQQQQQQTAAAQKAAQDRINQQEQQRVQSVAQQRAADTQYMLMQNSDNPRETDGMSMQISNQAGAAPTSSASRSSSSSSGSGASSGYAPPTATPQQQASDIAAAFAQMRGSLSPTIQPPAHIAAPAPPQLAGPSGMFSRAKDASGRTGSAAIKALHDLMTRRGMSDSGMEASGEAQILSGVAQQQSGAEYDAVAEDAGRRWEGSKLGYQGDLGQSSQGYQGAINQRGQDTDTILQMLSRIRF